MVIRAFKTQNSEDQVITIAMNVQTAEGYVGIQGEYGLLEFRKIQLEIL